ncbi:hypothetical protein F4859DRAFT_512405 [Xylaria cf. heliscus]|nr:hypothetical protein F4859DRAFT_512405 [Xylaria cf. heliscus]
MSNTDYVSPTKRDHRVNLDHLIISVKSRTGDTTDHALNEFLSILGRKSDIRQAVDYDYDMFRNTLLEKLNIDNLATLYPSNPTLVHITNGESFHGCLDQIQQGQVRVPRPPTYGLPYIEFSAVPERRNIPPQPQRSADTGSPTRRLRPRPVARPVNTPRAGNARGRREQNPVVIDLTQDPKDNPQNDKQAVPGLNLDGDEEEQPPDDTLIDRLVPRQDTEDEEWKQACDFFRCRVDDQMITVPGISLTLLPYQAFTVWRVFIQATEKNIPSFMIGDAPGLGKTGSE